MRPNGYLLAQRVGFAPEEIIREVARGFNLTPDDLFAHDKRPHVCVARACAMAVVRAATPLSFPAIGRLFDRDHTTVINAVQKVMADDTLQEAVALVVEELTLARRPTLVALEEAG